jgi:quercetin dioxygenase-like cupin family protein
MMEGTDTITISGPGDGHVLDILGAPVRVQSSGRDDQMFFVNHPVPAGYEVPLHVHFDEEELFYILDGEITFMTQNGDAIAGAGSFVHAPKGVAHGFANRSGRDSLMLVVTPAGGALQGVFRGLDAAAQDGTLGPASIAQTLSDNRLALA